MFDDKGSKENKKKLKKPSMPSKPIFNKTAPNDMVRVCERHDMGGSYDYELDHGYYDSDSTTLDQVTISGSSVTYLISSIQKICAENNLTPDMLTILCEHGSVYVTYDRFIPNKNFLMDQAKHQIAVDAHAKKLETYDKLMIQYQADLKVYEEQKLILDYEEAQKNLARLEKKVAKNGTTKI